METIPVLGTLHLMKVSSPMFAVGAVTNRSFEDAPENFVANLTFYDFNRILSGT